MKIDKNISTENYHFYSREILQSIACACMHNGYQNSYEQRHFSTMMDLQDELCFENLFFQM